MEGKPPGGPGGAGRRPMLIKQENMMGSPDGYPGNMGVWRSDFSISYTLSYSSCRHVIYICVCVCVIRPDEQRHGSPEVSDGGFWGLGYAPLQCQPRGIHDAPRLGVQQQQQQSHDVGADGGPLHQRTRYQFHAAATANGHGDVWKAVSGR